MSPSANVGLGRAPEICRSYADVSSPAAPRPMAPTPMAYSYLRRSSFTTTTVPVLSAGRIQPRFTLVVIHIGIDDQELGALSGGIGGDALSRWETSPLEPPCGTARPPRLATFSS